MPDTGLGPVAGAAVAALLEKVTPEKLHAQQVTKEVVRCRPRIWREADGSISRHPVFALIENRSAINHTGDCGPFFPAKLASASAAAAAAAAAQEPIFRSVNLAGNALRDEGARTMARMLRGNCLITSLDLRSNDIGIEGGAALFEALLDNSTLTEA